MSLLSLAAVEVKVEEVSPIIANLVWIALLAGIFYLATRMRRRRGSEGSEAENPR
jgi:hypothetical protein